MPFDIDFKDRGYIREHIWDFLLFPEHWVDPANQIPIKLVWKEIQFDKGNLKKVPNKTKGIYCFVMKPEFNQLFETKYLFYIGMTGRNFRVRFKEYLDDQDGKGKPRHKVFNMLKLWRNYLYFTYAEIPAISDIKDTEVRLLNTFVPKVNTDIPKARIKPELKSIYE